MAILGINSKVEVAKTFAAPVNITGISKGTTCTVTATNTFVAGDVVILDNISGMVELNGQAVRVSDPTGTNFVAEGINSTSFTTYTSGGTAKEVATWDTAGDAQSISAEQAQANRIETTTLQDSSKQYIFGLPDSPQITVQGLLNPTAGATATVRAASQAQSQMPVRVSFPNGNKLIFNSYASAGDGFSMQTGGLATTSWQFSQIKNMMWYST